MNEKNNFSTEKEIYLVIIKRIDSSQIECLTLNEIGLEKCKQDKTVKILQIKKEKDFDKEIRAYL